MCKRLLTIFVLLCLLAVGAAVCHAQLSPTPQEAATSMAALGLVLLDDAAGVSVLAVRDKSPADHAGICPGDVLLRADGVSFSDVLQLEDMLQNAQQHMQLQLRRDQDHMMTVRLCVR